MRYEDVDSDYLFDNFLQFPVFLNVPSPDASPSSAELFTQSSLAVVAGAVFASWTIEAGGLVRTYSCTQSFVD